MAKASGRELRTRSQVEAEKKLAKTAKPLSSGVKARMEARDPDYDRLDAAVDRRN
jgi:hypothetical protein